MAKNVNEYSNIDKRVSLFIEGKHGKIGIIISDHDTNLLKSGKSLENR